MVTKQLLFALLGLAATAHAQDGSCDVTPTTVDEPTADLDEGAVIDIVKVTSTSVKFTVNQVWSDDKLCLVATHYTSDTGNVCPMSPNVGPGEISEFEAICVNGKTTIQVYAYDIEFYDNTDTSFTIPDLCEQTEKIKTYEYIYEIPCETGDEEEECQAISCAYVDDLSYDFTSTADKEAWLFADTTSTDPFIVLQTDAVEITKTFDIPADTDFGTFTFKVMKAPGEALASDQELYARVGPYYFDLTANLAMLDTTGNDPVTEYFGLETVITTKDDTSGDLTITAKLPKDLYEEKGRLTLGVRSPGSGKLVVDDVSVTLSCPESSTKDPQFDDGGTSAGGGGGDPHFQRWDRAHSSFHGECDLVMVHSDEFHDNTGLDLHVRTKIEDYFSFIESAALRIGETIVEFHKEHFFLNGKRLKKDSLPYTFGNDYQYTISNLPIEGKDNSYYMTYKVDLHDKSSILLKFYKKYLTINVAGHARDFSDSTGLLGEFGTGEMISRTGSVMTDFDDFGFEWQVNPVEDRKIFLDDRAPQLPYERCRMPTAARPSRRHLRGDMVLLENAKAACAHVRGSDFDLCTDDIMTTGDMGLADLW